MVKAVYRESQRMHRCTEGLSDLLFGRPLLEWQRTFEFCEVTLKGIFRLGWLIRIVLFLTIKLAKIFWPVTLLGCGYLYYFYL